MINFKYNMKKVLMGFFTLLLLFTTACTNTYRVADLTVVSTKNVEVSNIDLNKAPQKKNVKGVSSRLYFLLIFPLSFDTETIYKATDDALYNGKGDLMVDAVIYGKTTIFFPIIKHSFIIKGTVIDTTGGSNE